MINFPVFEHLEVKDYGIYPGTAKQPGISVNFKAGLTLILGSNGLGKTTLITLIFRMLTGANDLPRTTLEARELGGARLDFKPLNAKSQAAFADRVQDAAANATAVLRLTIAGKRITIRRNLRDLSLIAAHIDHDEVVTDEAVYQAIMIQLSEVPTFGDWLLLLRSMVFYFEDRRELVWDASAQRHILRMMFLSPVEAEDWYRSEREILVLDSQYRNLVRTLNQLEKRVDALGRAEGTEESLREELGTLRRMQEKDDDRLLKLEVEADDLDARRHDLRRELLSAEIRADEQARALETEKLQVLASYFPKEQHTAQHLYSLLIAQRHCAVCGNEADEAAALLSSRVQGMKCVVCGHELEEHEHSENVISFSKEKIQVLHNKHEAEQERVNALRDELANIVGRYDIVATELVKLRVTVNDRTKQILRIERALPDGEKQFEAKQELSALRKTLEDDKIQLSHLAESFRGKIERYNTKILQFADEVKATFAHYASGFLAEDANLKWSLVKESLGETGIAKVEFPSFELEMTGSNFTAAIQRSGPNAVSESQREFIDLAFRMALIQVGSSNGGGSLVIDVPESSLDAYFVKRAAEVLCKFGDPGSSNRLIVASNLISGDLLPEMIRLGVPKGEASERIINLMDIAVPTAALRNNRPEYQNALNLIFERGGVSV